MTEATFNNHKQKHTEVVKYIDEAKLTNADSDVVQEADDGSVFLCRFGLGHEQFVKCWLVVIIHYIATSGKVATYFFSGNLPRKRILENRWQWAAGERFSLQGGGAT